VSAGLSLLPDISFAEGSVWIPSRKDIPGEVRKKFGNQSEDNKMKEFVLYTIVLNPSLFTK
jgi:hypothetical protein